MTSTMKLDIENCLIKIILIYLISNNVARIAKKLKPCSNTRLATNHPLVQCLTFDLLSLMIDGLNLLWHLLTMLLQQVQRPEVPKELFRCKAAGILSIGSILFSSSCTGKRLGGNVEEMGSQLPAGKVCHVDFKSFWWDH